MGFVPFSFLLLPSLELKLYILGQMRRQTSCVGLSHQLQPAIAAPSTGCAQVERSCAPQEKGLGCSLLLLLHVYRAMCLSPGKQLEKEATRHGCCGKLRVYATIQQILASDGSVLRNQDHSAYASQTGEKKAGGG